MKKEDSKQIFFHLLCGYFGSLYAGVREDVEKILGRELVHKNGEFFAFCKEAKNPVEATLFLHFLDEEVKDASDDGKFIWGHLVPMDIIAGMVAHNIVITKTTDSFGFPVFGFDVESSDEADIKAFDELHDVLLAAQEGEANAVRIFSTASRKAREACNANADYIGYYRADYEAPVEHEPKASDSESAA